MVTGTLNALQNGLSKYQNRPPALESVFGDITAHQNQNAGQSLKLDSAQCKVLNSCGVHFRKDKNNIDSFSVSPAFLAAISSATSQQTPLQQPPAPTQPIQKYFSGFTFKSVSSCAWKALKTSAWLMPLSIFASGLHTTNILASAGAAFAATAKAVGSFGLISSIAANPLAMIGIFAAGVVAYNLISKRLEKNAANTQAKPLNGFESTTAKALSFCGAHGGKAALMVAGAYFLNYWAVHGALIPAASATFGAALGTVASVAATIAGLGWGVPVLLFLYNAAKLRYENGSSAPTTATP